MTDPPDHTGVLMRLLAEEQRMLGLFHTLRPHVGHHIWCSVSLDTNILTLYCYDCDEPILTIQGEYADVREETPAPTPD